MTANPPHKQQKETKETAEIKALNEFAEKDENELKGEIDYASLLKLRPLKPASEGEAGTEDIVFYCRECKMTVEAKRKKGKGIKFLCATCNGGNIYVGSRRGITSYFRR